jgi:hypothetical protein
VIVNILCDSDSDVIELKFSRLKFTPAGSKENPVAGGFACRAPQHPGPGWTKYPSNAYKLPVG